MLYLIAEELGFPGVLNLIRYISFRAGAASATALERDGGQYVVRLDNGGRATARTVIVATGQSPANIIILSLTVVSVSFVGLGVPQPTA